MFNPFAYLREKAREAVLAGVHDALVQIDAGLTQTPAAVTPPPAPALAAGPPEPAPQRDTGEAATATPTESLQQRLARAADPAPPAPSAPRRGRGRPPQGDEA